MTKLMISEELFNWFYPVGSYYETSNINFNPSNAGWYGTWVEDSKGKVLVALDSEQVEFNQVDKTAGSKTNVLVPENYVFKSWLTPEDGTGQNLNTLFSPGTWYGISTKLDTNTNLPVNNLQPYKVVKRWHRIA